ncbi:MAG: isocitrate lyase/phosphoenolpyruvate mutase family protein, partial [Burkholderiales bacterium]
ALGVDEAIARSQSYVEAGAHIAFVESPESVEELVAIGRAFGAPKLANMVPGRRTPVVGAGELQAMGFNIAIYPGVGFSVAAEAVRRAYVHLLAKGSSEGMEVPSYGDGSAQSMHELMGFPEIWDFEKRWGLS